MPASASKPHKSHGHDHTGHGHAHHDHDGHGHAPEAKPGLLARLFGKR